MRRRYRATRALLALSLVLTMTTGIARATHEPTLLTDPPGDQRVPRTDGRHVVWLDYRAGDPGNADLYGADLESGTIFPIATEALQLAHPDVDAGRVVWSETPGCPPCDYDIVGLDLATGQRLEIATTPADESLPAISGTWVTWVMGGTNGSHLMVRDLHTGGEPIELARIHSVGYGPVIDGDRIVWEDWALDGDSGRWGLLTMRLDEQRPTLLFEGVPLPSGASGSFGYDLDGETVVVVDSRPYGSGGRLFVIDVTSGEDSAIAIGPYDQQPTIEGRYVIWEDHRFDWEADAPTSADIPDHWVDLHAYDRLTGSEFAITSGTSWKASPEYAGGVLVWADGRDGTAAIHTAPLTDRLPSAPVPGDSHAPHDGTYYPETCHTLQGVFHAFWEHSGGLPIFGYPLTETYVEQSQDTGQREIVQYVERQRFEWHPEHSGTPYEVLLGRLGAELLVQQGRDWRAFPTADPAAAHYFEQTGHAIAPEFREYWITHGLDLGDEGDSFRESLALFGYPLSEPMLETNADGHPVLTQYFERAVFELHPSNSAPYRVLLRRLGAESLRARGW